VQIQVNAEEVAIASLLLTNEEIVVVGHTVDIQRLYETGAAQRVWEIVLDNGHRPYANQKKRLTYDIDQEERGENKNVLTTQVSRHFGLGFTHNLHALEHTYLLRANPTFWSALQVVFANEDGQLLEAGRYDCYAAFRGAASAGGSIRFIRMELDTLL